jgi:hypothetical protein
MRSNCAAIIATTPTDASHVRRADIGRASAADSAAVRVGSTSTSDGVITGSLKL